MSLDSAVTLTVTLEAEMTKKHCFEHLVGLYSEDGNPIVLAVYQVRVTGGKLESADHETLDVRVFNVNELPELAFDHDRGILADWLKTWDVAK